MVQLKDVLKSPLISEKNTYHQEKGVYVFSVNRGANKTIIKEAVEKNFRVKVESVRTVVCRGRSKSTRFGSGQTPYWKKAFVKLKQGEKIALFEGA